MKLTPLDIKKQEFQRSLRGFDPMEVDSFLEMVADEFESIIREKNSLADEVLKLKTQLRDYQNLEKTLQDTLVTAQETIKASRENSQREADSIIREAELKSEQLLEESKLKLSKLKNELLIVKAQKDSFARRLKHLLESQLDLVEVLELDDLGFDKYEKEDIEDIVSATAPREEVEFEGVDEVLPEEAAPEYDSLETESREQRENLDLSENMDENERMDEGETENNEDKKSRISDHLIF